MEHHQQQQQQQHQQPKTTTTQEDESSSKQKKSRRRNKVVSFKQSVRMKLTRHHNDYTDKEYHACFYSSEEYQDFKNDAIITAQMIELQLLPTNEFTTTKRGIECRTIGGQNQRRKNRYESKFTVFQIQEKEKFHRNTHQDQCNNNIQEEDEEELLLSEKIAFAYSEATRSSRVVAHLIGLSDEREIQQQQQQKQTMIHQKLHYPQTTHRKRSFEKEESSIRVIQRNNSMDSPVVKKSSSTSTKDIAPTIKSSTMCRNSVLELLKYKLDFVDVVRKRTTSSSSEHNEQEGDDEPSTTLFATTTGGTTATNTRDISQQVLDLI